MAQVIQIKRGTGSSVPSSLAEGELAINLDSGKLYYGSGSSVSSEFTVDQITAETYVVSSSVTHMTTSFSSGSTAFGDSSDDIHTFTGNITASGNISSSGAVIGLTGSFNQLSVLSSGDTGTPPLEGHLLRITDTTNNNPDIEHFFAENDGLAYGMRWHYDGGDNNFGLYRHDNSTSGVKIVNFNRANSTSTFYGNVALDSTSTLSCNGVQVVYGDGTGLIIGQSNRPLSINSIGMTLAAPITASSDISASGDLFATNLNLVDGTEAQINMFQGATQRVKISGRAGQTSYIDAGNVGIGTTSPTEQLTVAGNIRVGADSTSNNWIAIDCQNGGDTTSGGISFYETGTYDVDTPQYGAKIVYNEDSDQFSLGTIQGGSYLKQISFTRNLSRTYIAGDLFVSDVSPLIYVTDTSTVVANGDTVGTIAFKNEDDDSTTARLKVIATEDHASNANGGSKWEFTVTENGSSTEVAALTIGQDKSLTIEGTVELGHATDTTLARVSAGVASIEDAHIKTQSLTIKVFPSEFKNNPDAGRPNYIHDGVSNALSTRGHGSSDDFYAFVEIPPLHKVTHVQVHASANTSAAVSARSFNYQTGADNAIASTAADFNENKAITNIPSTATQDLVIKCTPGASTVYVYGATVTLALI